MVYLRDHPPVRSQFTSPRRSRPSGLTVIHTAESVLDTIGPDTGAEAVAAFIQRRATPGSYHDLVDSDTALQLVRYEDEAYQDGTGSNPFALSISFALRTTDWRTLSPERRRAFLRQGAVAFARQQAWLRAKGYPTTPLRWLSRDESSRGLAGFITHALRDPARRSDPGPDFPAAEFFAECRAALAGPTTIEEDNPDMITVYSHGEDPNWTRNRVAIVDAGVVLNISDDPDARKAVQGLIQAGKALKIPVNAETWAQIFGKV